MKPKWMRRYIACPDCGHIYHDESDLHDSGAMVAVMDRKKGCLVYPKGYNCVQCKTHYTVDDFWEEQCEKWDRTMKEEE